MITVILTVRFASVGGVLGPAVLRSAETLDRRFGEFGHFKKILVIPRRFRSFQEDFGHAKNLLGIRALALNGGWGAEPPNRALGHYNVGPSL